MKTVWKFWSDASKEAKARKHLQAVRNIIEVETINEKIEPYHKGGFVFSFELISSENSWDSFVIETIAMGQNLGRGWILTGSIYEDPEGWTNDSTISGISSMQWICFGDEA